MRNGLRFSLGVFALSRLLTFLVIVIGTRLYSDISLHHAFLLWDSRWFHLTSMNGYPHIAVSGTGGTAQNTIAFFPMFPMTTRVVHDITHLTHLQSGILVSLVFGAIATCLLWILAARVTNNESANRAVALFCFFPGALSMLTLMSEPIMLTCAIGCILALLQRKWLIAGVLAAIATATRPNAIVLELCCLWAAFEAIRKQREWRSLVAPLLAPCGILAYFLFLWQRTGDFMAWLHVENAGWNYGSYAPFEPLTTVLFNPFNYIDNTAAFLALLVGVAGLYALYKQKLPPVLLIFAAGICLLAFESGATASKVRYVWSAFPLFIAFGNWATTRTRQTALMMSAVSTLCIYVIMSLFAQRLIP